MEFLCPKVKKKIVDIRFVMKKKHCANECLNRKNNHAKLLY